MGTRRTMVIGAALAALALSGCGKSVEKALEKASGCQKIDANAKNTSINCGGNTFDTGKLPEGWPDELKPPYNATLSLGTKSTSDGKTVLSVTMVVPGAAKDVASALKDQLSKGHYEVTNDSLSEGSGGVGGTLVAASDTHEIHYFFGDNPDASNKGTYIIATLTERSADDRSPTTSRRTTTTDDSEGSDGSDGSDGTSGSDGSDGSDSGGGASGSQSLPAGFPSELAPPSGAKIVASNKFTTNGTTTFAISATLSGSVEDVYDGLKSQLTGAGYKIDTDSLSTANGQSAGVLVASNDTYTLNAVIGLDTNSSSGTSVNMTLSTK